MIEVFARNKKMRNYFDLPFKLFVNLIVES